MITSYLTAHQETLYLALQGALDAEGAADLREEFWDRICPEVTELVVDLSAIERATPDGLDAVSKLLRRAADVRVDSTLVAAGSPAETSILRVAERDGVRQAERSALDRIPIFDAAAPFAPSAAEHVSGFESGWDLQ